MIIRLEVNTRTSFYMFKLKISHMYIGEGSLKIINNVRHNSRRWGIDIIACILMASHHGAKKTDLLSRCNLSFEQLKNYLNFALKKRLITVDKSGTYPLFRISNKGRALLESYEDLTVLIE